MVGKEHLSVRTPMTRLLLAAAVLGTFQDSAFGAVAPGSAPGLRPAGQVYAKSGNTNPFKAGKDPRIASPHSTPYGHTYGEWGAEWWQWVLSIPADRNPLTDATGEFCGEGQSGRVFFLAGTFGNSAQRFCVMSGKKPIFMPVFNWIFGSGVFDCHPTVPNVPCDVPTLRNLAAENTEKAEILEVTIDGVPVENLRDYRAPSPGPFKIVYPENSVTGVAAGRYFPQVSDGYWLMLKPLSHGRHIIQSRVRAPDTAVGTIDFTIVTHLLVQKGRDDDDDGEEQ